MELETLTHSQEIMLLIIMPTDCAFIKFYTIMFKSFFYRQSIQLYVCYFFYYLRPTYFKNPVAIGNFAMVKEVFTVLMKA